MDKEDLTALRSWFKAYARPMPWRQAPTPYGVWVSETMLQQTQVSVVIPYYMRWMERFPTIEALAAASFDDVLKSWEGLGYYSRARRLHNGAQQVMRDFGGQLPSEPAFLQQISGIGPYTLGAILSFAFKRRAAAVDGNVLRVLARYYGIEEEIERTSVIARLRVMAEELLPDEEPWVIAEALIELGATACNRKAACEGCPLRQGCKALALDLTEELPKRRPRMAVTHLYRAVALVTDGESYLVRKVAAGQLMEGLYEFPYLEMAMPPREPSQLLDWLYTELALPCTQSTQAAAPLAKVSHSFTRYKATLYPYHLSCAPSPPPEGYQWHHAATLTSCPFPSGHRSIAEKITKPSVVT